MAISLETRNQAISQCQDSQAQNQDPNQGLMLLLNHSRTSKLALL